MVAKASRKSGLHMLSLRLFLPVDIVAIREDYSQRQCVFRLFTGRATKKRLLPQKGRSR
jgi:hypothetical protein